MVGIAQLVSAPDCGSGGPGFESLYPPCRKAYVGLSPSGKAQDFDSCIRQFESAWPSYGILAQSVEHLTFNQVVRGSNPRCLIGQASELVLFSSYGNVLVYMICGYGGIGRRAGFRCQWATVWVRVPLTA